MDKDKLEHEGKICSECGSKKVVQVIQVKELIKKLSSEQWIEFIKYAASMYNKSYDITYYIKARE